MPRQLRLPGGDVLEERSSASGPRHTRDDKLQILEPPLKERDYF